jgi:hypothetical protein
MERTAHGGSHRSFELALLRDRHPRAEHHRPAGLIDSTLESTFVRKTRTFDKDE